MTEIVNEGIIATMRYLAILGLLAGTLSAQPVPLIKTSNGAPTGGCSANWLDVDYTTGTLYDCLNNSWIPVGGGGSVTSVGLALPAIFSVSGSPVTTSGTLTGTLATEAANLLWAGPTSGGAATPTFRAMVAADIPAAIVAGPALAVVQTRRVCTMTVGADNGASALVDGDLGPQGRQCFIPYAATVVEVTVAGDAGTPSVLPAKNHAGSATALLSGALATASSGGLACANTGGTTGIDGATTCSGTLNSTSLAAGDWLQLTSGTAGGVAKRMSISVTFTVN